MKKLIFTCIGTIFFLSSCGTSFTLPFNVVDEAPYILECIQEETPKERKKCTINLIQRYINETIDANQKKEYNLKTRQKFEVTFLITKSGNAKVLYMDSSAPVLNEHIIKVIESLPKFKPGKQKGETIGTTYTIPIVF